MTRELHNSKDLTGAVLACCAVVSVLAFGGVEPLGFAPVELAVVVLAVVQFWRKGWPPVSRPTLGLMAILLAIPALQILPLPSHWLSVISPHRAALTHEILSSFAPAGRLAMSFNRYETAMALLRMTCYVLVFLLAFQNYQYRREQKALIFTLILIGSIEAIYGIVQYSADWQYIFTYAKRYYVWEATGTYINHNHFAGLLEMALPFIAARILVRRPGGERIGRSRWKEMIVSPFSSLFLRDLILFVLLAVALLFSMSRLGIVSATVGVVSVAAVVFLRTKRGSTMAITFAMLAIPLAYAVWLGITPVVERFERLGKPAPADVGRLPVWKDTVVLIRDYPLFGTGLGTYTWSILRYQTSQLTMRYEHAHNDYLEFAADIGIAASVLLFIGLWILMIKVTRRALVPEGREEAILAAGCAGGMAAILVHEIADFNLQIPANAFIFAWIAGTAAALVRKPSHT